MNNIDFLKKLESGELRAAHFENGKWHVNQEVKQRILEVFKTSKIASFKDGFLDKADLYTQTFDIDKNIRLVPGGSSVRAGAYIGKNVIIMPPSYVNIGAYIGEETMVDSHVLVGSCAQIGKRIHLSAGVQIGGVLEPIGSCPNIIEDDCFIGANVVIVEGILIRKKAIIAPGVTLSKSIPIYDIVNSKMLKGEIPENAVVVPGSRAIKQTEFTKENNLSLNCAVIIKYRDEKTNSSLELEDLLR